MDTPLSVSLPLPSHPRICSPAIRGRTFHCCCVYFSPKHLRSHQDPHIFLSKSPPPPFMAAAMAQQLLRKHAVTVVPSKTTSVPCTGRSGMAAQCRHPNQRPAPSRGATKGDYWRHARATSAANTPGTPRFLPTPKMAPQESKHFGHKRCIKTPPSHEHSTITSTIRLPPI